VENLHHGAPVFTGNADMYEGGMLASPLLYALKACVGMFLELGPGEIEARVLGLAGRLRGQMRELGLEPLPYEDSAIVAAPMADAPGMAAALKAQRILVSARHGLLRVSTHFYNNEADLDRLVGVLGA
jgi:selenocysteine lyase/cysteine desulfurase